MSTISLNTPLEKIKGVSPGYLIKLKKLDINTLEDLIYHLPHRYNDFSTIIPVSQLKPNEIATVSGQIVDIKNIYTWHKKMVLTEALIKDQSGTIRCLWFNQPYLLKNFPKNTYLNLASKCLLGKKGIYLSNPACEKIDPNLKKGVHTGRLVSVYPETKGLTSRWLRYIINKLQPYIPEINDFLPYEVIKSQKLMGLNQAIRQIHFPSSQEYADRAKKRLSFDKLFLIQLSALKQKNNWNKNSAIKIKFNESETKNFVQKLPFALTNAQRKSAWEIIQDLEKNTPMNRLLEGDVGSGKTVVAAIAILQLFLNKYQIALMAPTEILAQQHFQTIISLFKSYPINIALLTSNSIKICQSEQTKSKTNQPAIKILHPKKEIGQLIELIADGDIDIIIGTHSLIQDKIKFKNLALVIIDEQHRFGVAQRATLQQKLTKIEDGLPKTIPHLLSMTATPIPRTLALTIYGDLDISLLDEIPANRPPIITKVVNPTDRSKAYTFIRQQIQQGKQIFIICPRIEIETNNDSSPNYSLKTNHGFWPEENTKEIKNVKEEYKNLSEKIFPNFKIGMLHGKLKALEKEKTLQAFKNKEIDILLSTSVVEVGIDIPNATVMVIEGAERFGLAQLHQLRGRVGRGNNQSYCFLFTEMPSHINSARLRAISKCKNGFELAEKDLAIRGPGDFYGVRQWGLTETVSAFLTDVKLIQAIRQETSWLIKTDPELKKYPLLQQKLRDFKTINHFE